MTLYNFNKYNARRTKLDGHIFDSQMEANRYSELKLMQKCGDISGLILQPMFVLLCGFTRGGKKIRPIQHYADFQYLDKRTGRTVVEDVKGVETPVWKIKCKLLLYQFSQSKQFKNFDYHVVRMDGVDIL